MKKIVWLAASLLSFSVFAQDPIERLYNYEILTPDNERKAPIKGFAKERVKENLGRSLYALSTSDGKGVYLSWRLLESDNKSIGFNVYRTSNGQRELLSYKPVVRTTDFVDANPVAESQYEIEPIYNLTPTLSNESLTVNRKDLSSSLSYKSFRLKEGQAAGKLAVADLNGDGEYDFIVRTPSSNVDPGMPGNTKGVTYTFSAYLNDGTHLWNYNLGQGIEPGIWYSPMIAYDFNGDGKAEVAFKIAPDAQRNVRGRVDSGDEFLLLLDGFTGKEIARAPWIERSWRLGDLNRQNRNQIGMAFLDGKTPAIISMRGTYRAMLAEAWQLLPDNKLMKLWRWDGDEENPVVRSQGAHSSVSYDVDGDGRDEILLGGCMLDDNGTLLWSAGIGHPDKAYLADVDPQRQGLEVFLCGEVWHDDGRGVCLVDAKTGKEIWNIGHKTTHVGDGMVTDFDPSYPGLECFASESAKAGSIDRYLLSSTGQKIVADTVPDCRNWVWWDDDLLRETFVRRASASKTANIQSIIKWRGSTLADRVEGDILMIADLMGDWREEIVTSVNGEIRIYRTNFPAKDRRTTLMQDPLYRSYVAHRSMGYPQAPVPSYYLGEN